MKQVVFFVFCILFSLISFSQTIKEIAYFSIYDSMGVVTYIKKSDIEEYREPQKNTKIFCYNEQLDTIGYWIGSKMKYINIPTKKESKIIEKR